MGSLAILELSNNVELDVGIEASEALRFSPDGSRLLVSGPDDELSVVATEGGTLDPLFSAQAEHQQITGLYWDAIRLELYYTERHEHSWRLSMIDETGSSRANTESGALEEGLFPFGSIISSALSPDGTQAAIWAESEECRVERWFYDACTSSQAVLVLVDTASGTTTTIGATQSDLGEQIAFSRDGGQLVYDGGDSLYVMAVP